MKTGEGSRLPAVIFLIGQEKWLKERSLAKLKGLHLAAGFEQMDFALFSDPSSHEEILEATQTLPFGSLRRLVVSDGLEEASEACFPWLSDYIAHPPSRCVLVISAQKLKQGRPLYHEEQRSGRVELLSCQPPKDRELQAWLAEQSRRLKKELEPQAAQLLVRRLGNDLQILDTALETLSLLAGDSPLITSAHVEALIVPSMKETAFDILDQAAAGHPEAAIILLRQALAQGKISVEQLMGALGWFYRAAWKAKETPLPSWGSREHQAAMARLSHRPFSKLEEAFDEVLKADLGLKLGQPAPEFLADRLLLQLAQSPG